MKADAGYLTVHDGGSEHAEIISNLNGVMNDTKISTPRNQIFIVLDANGKNNASIRLNATVFKCKIFDIIHQLKSTLFLVHC